MLENNPENDIIVQIVQVAQLESLNINLNFMKRKISSLKFMKKGFAFSKITKLIKFPDNYSNPN